MAISVKKTLQQYRQLKHRLTNRLEELKAKRERLCSRQSDLRIIHEGGGVVGPGGDLSASRLSEEIPSRATEILIDILNLKLQFIDEKMSILEVLVKEDSRQNTPMELEISRFEDWVDTNQQFYDLDTQLFDTQKSKFDIENVDRPHVSHMTSRDLTLTMTATESTVNIKEAIRSLNSASFSNMSLYVAKRLRLRKDFVTIEAAKIEEYVRECHQYQTGTLDEPPVDSQGYIRGAHPRAYHAFLEILCNYITERHHSSQGEELSTTTIYTAIEHELIPKIKPYIMRYINQQEKDEILYQQCQIYHDVTLAQLRVPLQLRSKELVPFTESIVYMRGSYFSQSPTDKMFSIVAAAKALHDQLGMMDEGGIDGDTFLDLWVYVSIQANIKNMATNMLFMSEYGNPQLSIAEAGYYLTTLNAAMNFIERLTPEQLKIQDENNTQFIVCELSRAKDLSSQPGSCFKLVEENTELIGYKACVIRDWILDTSRLFQTVLISTNDPNDAISVSILRLTSEGSSPQLVEYFYELLTKQDIPGLSCRNIELGLVNIADPRQCAKEQLIILPSGSVGDSLSVLIRVTQLLRLGSKDRNDDDEDPATHQSLPRNATSSSPFDIISPGALLLKDNLKFDDEEVGPFRTRSRFSLPVKKVKKQLKLVTQGSIQNEKKLGSIVTNRAVDIPPSPTSPGILVTAEVHSTFSLSPGTTPVPPSPEASFISGTSPIPPSPGTSILGSDMIPKDEEDVEVDGNIVKPISSVEYDDDDPFSDEYITMLEMNFINNHLYGNRSVSIDESMNEIIKQCQIILQRLNYLSTIHELNGIYDNCTMYAIQQFQTVHNKQDKFHSVLLPTHGMLSPATFQYLRQEFMIIFSSFSRLYKDLSNDKTDLLTNYNPLSTDPSDVKIFTNVVTKFQRDSQLDKCQYGVLCIETVLHIQQLLRTRRNTL